MQQINVPKSLGVGLHTKIDPMGWLIFGIYTKVGISSTFFTACGIDVIYVLLQENTVQKAEHMYIQNRWLTIPQLDSHSTFISRLSQAKPVWAGTLLFSSSLYFSLVVTFSKRS